MHQPFNTADAACGYKENKAGDHRLASIIRCVQPHHPCWSLEGQGRLSRMSAKPHGGKQRETARGRGEGTGRHGGVNSGTSWRPAAPQPPPRAQKQRLLQHLQGALLKAFTGLACFHTTSVLKRGTPPSSDRKCL